jgi:hypothetical protein
MITRRNIIYTLIVISLLLIIINISLEFGSTKEEIKTPELSKSEIENNFALAFNDFGIHSDWIKKVFVKEKLSDSLDYLFNISIPQDVTIASLIKDINRTFINTPANVETNERKNYSNSVLKIYSGGMLKLQANLNHSSKIIREYAQYSFMVYTDFDASEIYFDDLSKIFFDFTYLIIPSDKSVEFNKRLNGNYAVLLNDKIVDTDFSLEEDFSKQKLTNNIQSILITFGKDKTYLIDDSSLLFKSKIYSLLRDEFNSRGVKLIPLNKFPYIKGNSEDQLNSLYQFYITSLKGKEGKTFIIDLENFLKLKPVIELQLKRGDKVVEFSLK